MDNLINQPDFFTSLSDLNFPMDALERCASNPLIRCFSDLSVTSQDGGATFVPFGRAHQELPNNYILPVLVAATQAAQAIKEEKSQPQHIEMDVSSMTIAELIRMNLSLKELLDYNIICRFFKDQAGSRYVQNKLCHNIPSQTVDDVLNHMIKERQLLSLSKDIYANYPIQIMFDIANRRQRQLLFEMVLRGNVYRLSHSFYGCRVVQKALDKLSTLQCIQIVKELKNKLIRQCIIGQNSNHVLQKILALKLEREHIQFIINCIVGDIYFYSTHIFGCRIVQNIIKNYTETIINKIVSNKQLILSLAMSEYGNYVVQDILNKGDEYGDYKSQLILSIFDEVVILSKNKFGSNVVEKCLSLSSDNEKDILLKQIIKNKSTLSSMVTDNYANYVVQKLLIDSNHKQQSKLIYLMQKSIPNLRSLRNGKRIDDKIRKIKQKYKSNRAY